MGGGVRLTQTLHYPENQRHIDKTWAVENLSVDKTYDNLTFIHGGIRIFLEMTVHVHTGQMHQKLYI